MLKHIKHGINLVKHALRDVGNGAKRSGKWEIVERHFKENNPSCAACGSKNRLNVHHILPFHIHPELELDPNNLITLCMDVKECHLQLGHAGDFKKFNDHVREDAAKALKNPEKFEEIVKNAFNNRKVN